jgi:ankyrin repeat protein
MCRFLGCYKNRITLTFKNVKYTKIEMEDLFEHLKKDNVEYLINNSLEERESTALLSFRDEHGNTPLHIASGHNSINCVKFILDCDSKNTLINLGNIHGDTPLHNAVYGNYKECLEILLNHSSIDIDPKNEYGNTPLMYASLKNSVECIKSLLEHNADTSIQNKDGMTFFDLLDEDIKTFIKEYSQSKKVIPNF